MSAEEKKHEFLIRHWAALRGLDPAMVYGVMMTESSGNPNAKNPADPSAGLMQTIPLITRAYGGVSGTDEEVLALALNPEVSMKAGTGFLQHLNGRYRNAHPLKVWVQAYNLGEPQFDKGFRNPAYGERVVRFMADWN